MLHAQIRDAVEARLRVEHGSEPRTRYRHELGLCLGETRVDVAAINGQLTGCEIKGASDKLTRLPRQVELYGMVLDSAVLVVEGKHSGRAAAMVEPWWGVWHADQVDGSVTLEVVSEPQRNPAVQPLAVAQLLWRDEAFDILKRRDLATGMGRATRWDLWDRLVEELELAELQLEVREQLKARRQWPGGA